MNQQVEQMRIMVTKILDLNNPAHSLRPEVVEMTSIFANSQSARPIPKQNILEGETRTSNGLALSPAMATMCADDFMRTITFIRGTYAAIVDIRNRFPDRPVHILYVGCGPYATLAVPLMAIFTSSEANFTLLDLHPESIISTKSLIDTLSFSESVVSWETVDASSYCVCPDRMPDIILIETMQACLESEPQVAITRHLLAQAPDAILLPHEVRVDLKLVDPNKEFELGVIGRNEGHTHRDRLPVGPIFVVNRESIKSWKNISSNCLPGLAVQFSGPIEQRYQPMLFTEVCVYQKHILKDYDSGLTCPRVLSTDKAIKAGQTIQFYYDLGIQPRLRSQVYD